MIIFLDRAPADIIKDVDTTTRPLLTAGRERIFNLYAQRQQLYLAAADCVVPNRGPVKEVLKQLFQAVKDLNLA